jgi:hypothetical protein
MNLKLLGGYVLAALLLSGAFFGWLKMREKHAAERALWELRVTELVADVDAADSIIAARDLADSARMVRDSARLDSLNQYRVAMWEIRGQRDRASDSVALLRDRVPLAELPDSIRELILAERRVAELAQSEANRCATALTLSDSLRLSCEARVAVRDSTILLLTVQRDDALTLLDERPEPPSFMQRLPGEALKAGLFTTLGVLIGALIFGGGS